MPVGSEEEAIEGVRLALSPSTRWKVTEAQRDAAWTRNWMTMHKLPTIAGLKRAIPWAVDAFWRSDARKVEVMCAHGVGHPICAEDAGYFNGVHGCDGCCCEKKKKPKPSKAKAKVSKRGGKK